MKRRRIREIVAAAIESYTGEPTAASEVTVSVERDEHPSRRVAVEVIWGRALGPSKRGALQTALAAHGWSRSWPGLTGDERWLLGHGKPFCAVARSQGRGDLWLLEHLRERVNLP